jgi:hypothetical protein
MRGLVAALALVAAGLPQSSDSGVKGIVTIGPTCPVQRPGDPNCRDKPYRTTFRVARGRHRTTVKRFASAANGHFTVHLSPGRYVIEPTAARVLPRAAPVAVTVKRHRFAHVAIEFDSGIR